MISGANHLEVPTAPGVAATVKLGSEFMGANPYSVKRARPFLSTTMFACDHRINAIAQPGRRERERDRGTQAPGQIPPKDRKNDPPLLSLHAECPGYAGIPTPL